MTIRVLCGLLLAGAAIQSNYAVAQEVSASTPAPAAADQLGASPFGEAKPVTNADLHSITGQGDLAQVVNAENKGVVSGNTITGASQTGTIHFDSSSFQNLNGLSLLSANTGNNVSINSSLNVNVAISNR